MHTSYTSMLHTTNTARLVEVYSVASARAEERILVEQSFIGKGTQGQAILSHNIRKEGRGRKSIIEKMHSTV
jgi:hypothetical protein